jgi:hypothetical protein
MKTYMSCRYPLSFIDDVVEATPGRPVKGLLGTFCPKYDRIVPPCQHTILTAAFELSPVSPLDLAVDLSYWLMRKDCDKKAKMLMLC